LKRKLFRKLVDIADRVNIWFTSSFNLNPKRRVLEIQQDLQITMQDLDNTIGKALEIK
jgi:hypothetical protein